MSDPIVIDPPNFDQRAAWNECSEFVEKCGGLQHDDGEVNWRAAFGADPGCCSCPACGETYWAWGRVQRCVKCAFEYPTDWWPMYSWGTQAAIRPRLLGSAGVRHDKYMQHPYYRHGFENPADEPWATCHTEEWRAEIRARFPVKETPT
jgi:hypothetical protein